MEQVNRVDVSAEDGLLGVLLMLEESGSFSLTRDGCEGLRRATCDLDLSSLPLEHVEAVRKAIDRIQPGVDEEGQHIWESSPLEFSSQAYGIVSVGDVRLALGGPRFVYHGTTLGRLESIRQHGLLPDQAAVWKEGHLQQHRESGIFFADTFGGAEGWACFAFSRCRGRRASIKRRALVLRLPAEGLILDRDRRAMAPGCLVSRQAVDVSSAEWALAGSGQVPHWRGIREQLASDELPELPMLYRRV